MQEFTSRFQCSESVRFNKRVWIFIKVPLVIVNFHGQLWASSSRKSVTMGLLLAFSHAFSIYFTFVNIAIVLLIWLLTVAAYRLWFGPLASFPGPRLAALTGWYETYFECLQRGRYWVEIERMHEQYGKEPLPDSCFSLMIIVSHCTSHRSHHSHQSVGVTCKRPWVERAL